ncbi:hypothetical protein [Sphingobacterium bambusae]|uniref:Uncharacterized protein n=1 Tax=Sphingobacterium bambusae TaxID=662858 RepID=A0ABW6B9S8_9SPHI|nr:hypothetical protein [Sphingobacterium bambusae]WPL48459.1 hypothetical protein SCB77_21150 [Sphingobacterium bambusae]
MKPIKNNKLFKDLEAKIADADILRKHLIATDQSGSNLEQLAELEQMLKSFDALSNLADNFNRLYGDMGWVAHESMQTDLLKHVVEDGLGGNLKAGEIRLVAYYNSNQLQSLLKQFKRRSPFKERYGLYRAAFEDTLAGRYHASIPLLLMMMDGVVADLLNGNVFFTESSDLTFEDSIAGHQSGLPKIREVFSKARKTTRSEDISIPYRNGILHGRDLGYANSFVNAKCWAATIAMYDWGIQILNSRLHVSDQLEAEKTKSIHDEQYVQKTTIVPAETRILLPPFETRVPEVYNIGEDYPANGPSTNFSTGTPLRFIAEFVEYWQSRNYYALAEKVSLFGIGNKRMTTKELAGIVRSALKCLVPEKYQIVSAKETSPSRVEIQLNIFSGILATTANFAVFYQGEDGKPRSYKVETDGKWKIYEGSIRDYKYCTIKEQ